MPKADEASNGGGTARGNVFLQILRGTWPRTWGKPWKTSSDLFRLFRFKESDPVLKGHLALEHLDRAAWGTNTSGYLEMTAKEGTRSCRAWHFFLLRTSRSWVQNPAIYFLLCRMTLNLAAPVFPECVARVPVSLGGLGVRLCSSSFAFATATVGNRRQPSPTVANRLCVRRKALHSGECVWSGPESVSSWVVASQLYWCLQRRCLWESSVSPQFYWCL